MPRTTSFVHKLGPYAHRLQPRTLRGRLASGTMAFTVLAVLVSLALSQAAALRQFDRLSEDSGVARLEAFRTFLDGEIREVDLYATDLGFVLARDATASAAPPPVRAIAAAHMRQAEATALLRTDANGRPLYSLGNAEDTAQLAALASRRPDEPLVGLLWMTGGPSAVSCRPVFAEGSTQAIGYIAVARPIEPAARERFQPMSEDVVIRLRAPGGVENTVRIAGFDAVTAILERGVSRTTAVLPSLEGSSAGVAEITVRDRRITAAVGAARTAAIGASLLAGLIGAGLGLALAGAVRAPIERTRLHLRDEGSRALDGLPCKPMEVRPETTREFVGLAREVDGLLAALSSRQGELVAATDEARRAQASLQSAIDDSPEAKLISESDRIVLANPAAEEMLGIPVERLVGMTPAEVIDSTPAFGEDGHRITVTTLQQMRGRPVVVRIADPSRAERWVELTTVPHPSDPSRVLISARDITEERRLEALREEIFSLVSHDLRAPLTVVRGYLDILERPLQPEARARALESARHNASKMAALLEDLLDATAPEELLAPKTVQPVDLCALAREVVDSMQATAPGHSIVAVCDGELMVDGEERRLRQAAVNLVANALKYAPEDTTVTVRTVARDGRALLLVEDEGPGVPAEAREAVFTRYRRLASAESKPGLGLGLYIVRIVAEKHGGSARVEDAPGGGARFVLELPLSGNGTASA